MTTESAHVIVPVDVVQRAIQLIQGAEDMFAMPPGERWDGETKAVLDALREALS